MCTQSSHPHEKNGWQRAARYIRWGVHEQGENTFKKQKSRELLFCENLYFYTNLHFLSVNASGENMLAVL